MPHATASSNGPAQFHQESAVPKEGCRQFNSGRTCARSKKGAVCQFVHDSRLRAEAINEKRAANKTAKQVNDLNTEANKESSGRLLNVTSLSVPSSKTPKTPAPKPAQSGLMAASETPSQTETHPLPDGYCHHFVRKECKLEYCPLIHDYTARREFRRNENKRAGKKRKKPATKGTVPPLKENIPPLQSKIDSRPSRSKDCTLRPTPTTSGPTTNFGFQSWDPMTLKLWATKNLSSEVLEKYLKFYGNFIDSGNIPLAAIAGTVTELKRTKKNRKNTLQPLPHFHLFNDLPYELREQIWKFYLDTESEQCIIALKRKTRSNGTDKVGFRRLSPLPTPLEVCGYLRELALKRHYELAFGTRDHKPRGYFNYQNDRLFMCNDGPSDVLAAAKALRSNDRKRVRLLALPLRDWLKGNKIDFGKGVAGFTGLRSLHILVGDSAEDEEYLRISAKILEKIQKDVSMVWKANNGPDMPKPKVYIKVIPAFTAKQYRIDGLRW